MAKEKTTNQTDAATVAQSAAPAPVQTPAHGGSYVVDEQGAHTLVKQTKPHNRILEIRIGSAGTELSPEYIENTIIPQIKNAVNNSKE